MTIYEQGDRMTSPFGMRTLNGKTAMHNGGDAANGRGSKQRATVPGLIEWVNTGYNYGRGANVIIKHETARGVVRVRHQHADRILVKEGQRVEATEYVATEGTSGNVTGSHDHYEVVIGGTLNRNTGEIVGGKAVEPSPWLGYPNAVGTYPRNDEVYDYGANISGTAKTQEDNDMTLKVCAPVEQTPRSSLVAEGWVQLKDSDGTVKMYNPKGARYAKEVAADGSNLSPAYEECVKQMQPGEILLAVE